MSERVHVVDVTVDSVKFHATDASSETRALSLGHKYWLYGLRLFLNRRDPRRKPGMCFVDQNDCCYILQKIQCTFKIDVPGMGHLGGGSDKDVCFYRLSKYHHAQLGPLTDQGIDKGPTPDVVGVHLSLFVGSFYTV